MKPKQTVKFGSKAFFQRTPSLFRRIGNMFFSISTLGGTFAFLEADKRIGYALLGLAIMGKALTEFFSQDELEKDYESEDEYGDSPADEDDDYEEVISKKHKHKGPVTVEDIVGPPEEKTEPEKDNVASDCD